MSFNKRLELLIETRITPLLATRVVALTAGAEARGLKKGCYSASHHGGHLTACGFALTSQIRQATHHGILKDVYNAQILKN